MKLHIPPVLSCTTSAHLSLAHAHATAATTPRRAQTKACVRSRHSSSPALWPFRFQLHFTAKHISPHYTRLTACPALSRALQALARLLACLPAYRITARQPRSNATGLATLIVSAPDNLCLVGQVPAIEPRPLSAIPVPVCLT
jgi:hypothetical protein